MRISDWSSDVCSSDLARPDRRNDPSSKRRPDQWAIMIVTTTATPGRGTHPSVRRTGGTKASSAAATEDRKSVVEGKSVAVRVDLSCHRFIYKKNTPSTKRNTLLHRTHHNKHH